MQTRLALQYLDRLLREITGNGFRAYIEVHRPPDSTEKTPWYRVARDLSELTEVDVSPETVRRWYET